MGDRQERIFQAIDQMKKFSEVKKISTLRESEAAELNAGQPRFINAVVELDTSYEPEAVLDELLKIEKLLGRNISEKGKNQPREIDLDLIVYGCEIVKTDRLQVPHPRMSERLFVLLPLVELNPNWVHPQTKMSAEEMLKCIQA